MKRLWKFSVTTPLEAEDAITEMLTSLTGKPAAACYNLQTKTSEVSVFAEKPFPRDLRGKISAALQQISDCGLDIGSGKIRCGKVRREDWAESWKKHFKPLEFGDALLIKPSWIKKAPKKNQAVVVLDPGLSFGTGQHATTGFCLSEIVRLGKMGQGKSFLDIGTGSGILAIAAAKLNFAPIEAFDFDPESVRVAAANAAMNGIAGRVKLYRGDVTKLPRRGEKKYDLVCANLISNLLVAQKKRIVSCVKPEGTLVLAGILAAEFSEVQREFETLGLKLVAAKTEKEWRSGSFQFLKN